MFFRKPSVLRYPLNVYTVRTKLIVLNFRTNFTAVPVVFYLRYCPVEHDEPLYPQLLIWHSGTTAQRRLVFCFCFLYDAFVQRASPSRRKPICYQLPATKCPLNEHARVYIYILSTKKIRRVKKRSQKRNERGRCKLRHRETLSEN